MFNINKIKRQFTIIIICIIISVFYRVGLQFGLLGSMVSLLLGGVLCLFLSNVTLKTPLRSIEEGAGILALDQNSTGIINTWIVNVCPPKMTGWFKNKFVKTNYDRAISFSLKNPKNGKGYNSKPTDFPKELENKEGIFNSDKYIYIKLSKNSLDKNRFGFNSRPVLLFNSMSNTFISKEFFSKQEKNIIAQHSILFDLNDSVNDLLHTLKDFARHSINQLGRRNPLGQIIKSKTFQIIIIITMIILGLLFLPQIMDTLGGLKI